MKLFQKRNKKLNNKGFSLVELIVVVMIIAILAVSLAPQVMKWVRNARVSADISTVGDAVNNAQTALMDRAAYKAVNGSTYWIYITSTGGTVVYKGDKCTGTALTDADAFYKAYHAIFGSDKALTVVKLKSASLGAVIKVTTSGVTAYEVVSAAGAFGIFENEDGKNSANVDDLNTILRCTRAADGTIAVDTTTR